MKTLTKSFKKSGKGQVLVMVALTLVALVAIIGLAIDMGYMYVSYARLRRAADAASLAGSGEFKRNYTRARLDAAARQVLFLNLNGPDTSDSAVFPIVDVATCDTVADDAGLTVKDDLPALVGIDPGVCSDPPRKIVRTTVRQNISTYFLGIIGIQSFPVEVESISEAATVDVLMAIDTSESMSVGWSNERVGDDRDPTQCNIYDTCYPFKDVKDAAALFLRNLYFPYDRVGIITFDNDAKLRLPMNDDFDTVDYTIKHLKVYEGHQNCSWKRADRSGAEETYPADYSINANPCRLYTRADEMPPNSYVGFDCGAFYGALPDASSCPTTNTSDGVALGGAILTGDYSSASSYYPMPADGWPVVRSDSLWVLLLLTDGAANSGHDTNGGRICPISENSYEWFRTPHPLCRDADTLTRHCLSITSTDCLNSQYPDALPFPLEENNIVDADNYDGDDRARDMFDIVSRNNTLIFTIGMGSQTKQNSTSYDINGLPPGETLLKYGAYGTTNDKTNANALLGLYYFGNNSTDLTRIFLQIANNLATRINQ